MSTIYWHIQMNLPEGRGKTRIDSTKMLTELPPVIGTGEWEDIQCEQFKGITDSGLHIGDIILVREGVTPIALCEVVGSYFTDSNLTAKYLNEIFREVKILHWCTEKSTFPQPQGTLQRLLNSTTDSWIFIDNLYKKFIEMDNIKRTIELLELKKQIILQGPPGTGKTRLAKEIALELAKVNLNIQPINETFIKTYINPSQKFITNTDEKEFTVDSITGNTFTLKLSTGATYPVSVEQIIKCIREPDQPNLPRTYAKVMGNYLVDLFAASQYKLIQFHPAYSYEDFVRGIVVENNDGEIEYVTKNKILGMLIAEAGENYAQSLNKQEEQIKEVQAKYQLDKIIQEVEKEIAEKGKYPLLNDIYIYQVAKDAFKYKGNEWSNYSRINFKELLKIVHYNDKKTDPEIHKNISTHAFYRASYYKPILKMFLNTSSSPVESKVDQKNYVLIIDEINRANLPSVLGELIYALEYRGEKIEGVYDIDEDRTLVLPPNLYIIGTMNTADRSVGHIDYAIRRRFAFVDVLPTDTAIDNVIKEPTLNKKAKDLFKKVSLLFYERKDSGDTQIIYLQGDFKAKDVQLGHSYFLAKTEKELELKLEYEIKPLLNEYIKDGILDESAREIIKVLNV